MNDSPLDAHQDRIVRRVNPERVQSKDGGTYSARGGQGAITRAILHAREHCLWPTQDTPCSKQPPENSDPTCPIVAIKVLISDMQTTREQLERKLTRELLIWSPLQSDHIIKLLAYHYVPEGGQAWLICPWVSGGDARSYIRMHNPDMNVRFRLAADAIEGLIYLHSRNPPIYHGDIKALNLLVSSTGRGRLCDFGLAGSPGDTDWVLLMTESKFQGTIPWCSPAVLDGQPRTPEDDIWSLGWLVWELVTGLIPFHDTPAIGPIVRAIAGHQMPDVSDQPEPAGLVMEQCWHNNPQDRLRLADARIIFMEAITQHAQHNYPPLSAAVAHDVLDKSPVPPLAPENNTTTGPTPPPTGVNIRNIIAGLMCCNLCRPAELSGRVPRGPSILGLTRPGDDMHLSTPPPSAQMGEAMVVDVEAGEQPRDELRLQIADKSDELYFELIPPGAELSESLPLSDPCVQIVTGPANEGTATPAILPKTNDAVVVKVFYDIREAAKMVRGNTAAHRNEKRILESFREYIHLTSRLDHPAINRVMGYTSVNGIPSAITFWCPRGNIWQHIQADRSTDRADLMDQVGDGLEFLHSQEPPIIHTSLKPENVLIDHEGRARLTDVGKLGFLEKLTVGLTTCGTLADVRWMPPPGESWSIMTDVYTFGLLLLAVMSRKVPYADLDSPISIARSIGQRHVPVPESHPGIPLNSALWTTMGWCWNEDPFQRPGVSDIRAQIQEWDQQNNSGIPYLTSKVKRIGDRPFASGSFSDVWLGELSPAGTKIAMKTLYPRNISTKTPAADLSHRMDRRIAREAYIWFLLEHPRIAPLLGIANVEGRKCLISPWYSNGNADEYISTNPGCDRGKLVIHVAEGLVYLHTHEPSIIHGDVKPFNIVIDDFGEAKLIDFGLSKLLNDISTGFTTSSARGGTLRYMSPEVIADPTSVTVHSDVYSFGLCALEMMTGRQPFYEVGTSILRIIKPKFEGAAPDPGKYPELPESDPIWPLLRSCWSKDPNNRPTMEEVLQQLRKIYQSRSEENQSAGLAPL